MTKQPSYDVSFKRTYKTNGVMRNFARYFYLYQITSRNTNVTSSRLYDREIRRLRSSIGDDFFIEKYDNGTKTTTFLTNIYSNNYNYIVNIYFNRSLTENSYIYISALLALANTSKPLNSIQLSDKITTAYMHSIDFEDNSDNFESIPEKSLKKVLLNLREAGIIKTSKIGRVNHFSLNNNPLDELSLEEIQELYDFAHLYVNQGLLSVPGYYLINTLKKYAQQKYNAALKDASFWQFRFNNFAKSVDDETVYKLIPFLNTHQNLAIKHKNTPTLETLEELEASDKEVTPKLIQTNYPYHRQYLISPEETLKTENIIEIADVVDTETTKGKIHTTRRKKFQHLGLIFNFSEEKDPRKICFFKNRIAKEAGWMTIDFEGSNFIKLSAQTNQLFDYIPWILSFHKYVTIDEDTDISVQQKLDKDRKELLHNYGII